MKKKSKFPLILALLTILLTNLGNYWYFNIYQEGLYKEQTETLSTTLTSYKTSVYTPLQNISAGTKITEDMVVIVEGFVSNKTGLFTASDIGKTAIANIPASSFLYSNMVYDETLNPGNTIQCSSIIFPSNTVDGNYADIRIRFPNGSDFVVIPKTQITGVNHEDKFSLLTITEEEIQRLSSAEVDMEFYMAELYATIYVSPETQSPTPVTYIPRKDTLSLLYKDNELSTMQQLRNALEVQIGD